MAYIPGFEVDVFISYAHRNKDWVAEFHAFLARRVPEFLEHEADVEVWRDLTLSGFDELWPTLHRKIESSALFLSICSPVYVTSANCAKEVEHFLAHSQPTPLDRKARMARVAIIPYTGIRDALPPFRQNDTVYYTFYEERPDETIEQFDAASPRFRTEADRVAQHIASQLRRIHEGLERTVPAAQRAKRRTLFIATTCRDHLDQRRTLLNEFKEFEPLTIPDGSYSSSELEAVTRDLLAQAACSIHLLGANPGGQAVEEGEPFSRLQYRMALQHRPPGFTQLVWAPATKDAPTGAHREFVENVRGFNPEVWNPSTEVLTGTFDELLRAVQGVLTREAPVTKVEGAGPVYVLCSKADLEQDDGNLMKLRDTLFQAGMLPEFPAFDAQDVDLAEVERMLISESCGTVIYYGRGGDGWLKLKLKTLVRVLGDLKAQDQYVRALYLGTPANPVKEKQYLGLNADSVTDAKGFPPLLLLGKCADFEPGQLAPLLRALSQGEGATS